MENRGKRIASLLLALLLVFAMTACTEAEAPTQNTTQGNTEPSVTSGTEPATESQSTQAPTQPTEPEQTQPTQPTEPEQTQPTQPTEPEQTQPTQPPETEPTQPTEPEPHTHVFGEWEVVTTATCTEDGSQQRVCECGETETETIPATGHNYVNGICACGAQNFAGTLVAVDNVELSNYLFSNGSVFNGRAADGKCYVYSLAGQVLAGPYDYMNAVSYDGYIVAWNQTKEITGTALDWNDEICDVWATTETGYVLDSNGNVLYQTVGSYTDSCGDRTYEGEFLETCCEGRIITVSWDTYWLGMAANTKTVHIYDMAGQKIADIADVYANTGFVNGKMVLAIASEVKVVDLSGNTLAAAEVDNRIFPVQSFSTGSNIAGFTNGYMMVNGIYGECAVLISEDLQESYLLDAYYLCNRSNYGTLVFARIVEGDTESDAYYLVDVSKCGTDSYGWTIPTKDAVVCDTPVAEGMFWSYYGQTAKYALISTTDGKWGYMSLDGEMVKLYDDAGYFVDGKAIVMDGGQLYVIDESFNQISNSLTGYDVVCTSGSGVYALEKDGIYAIAIYQ